MRRIFKYPMKVQDWQVLTLPKDSRIISTIEQNNTVMIYAIVNPEEKEEEKYNIRIAGTGHPIHEKDVEGMTFLGTVIFGELPLVWHVFYQKHI